MMTSTFRVMDERGNLRRETDDWVDAQQLAVTALRDGRLYAVYGTHPSHDWDDERPRRCRNCDGWDNGSYGSQAPCGYDWSGEGGSSLAAALKRELAKRAEPEPEPEGGE